MKLLIPLLVLVAMVAAGGEKEQMMMKKWAWGHAMGACFGKGNEKFMMKHWKKVHAECKNMDAPELDLPFFNSPFRIASSLLNGAMSEENSGFPEKLFMKFMREQVMKRFANSNVNRKRREIDTDAESTNVDTLALGDRLIEKLNMEKIKMQSKIGNYSCMFQKSGIINEENELQLDNMITFMREGLPEPVNPWVLERVIEDKKKCYDFAQAIPEEFFKNWSCGLNLGKVKMFMKCAKISKAKTCMAYDIRQNLEENFGTVDNLMEQSDLDENELYALVGSLMSEDM